MEILIFIIGAIFGSFYTVVGVRCGDNKSIIYPKSHCDKCHKPLSIIELIPIISYILQKGKCKNCNTKIPLLYFVIEIVTATLFLITYKVFGFTIDIIIPLTFISLLIIVIVSDIKYMIIPDNVLITFGILLIVEIVLIYGPMVLLNHLLGSLYAFIFMFLLKKLGDLIFKKESMGGGDIKLMAILGLVIGFPMSVLSIFFAAILALPVSLIFMKKNNTNIIPFGPFIAISAIIIILNNINFEALKDFLLSI